MGVCINLSKTFIARRGNFIAINESYDCYFYVMAGDIRWKYQNEENQFKGKYLVSFANEVE